MTFLYCSILILVVNLDTLVHTLGFINNVKNRFCIRVIYIFIFKSIEASTSMRNHLYFCFLYIILDVTIRESVNTCQILQ